jgi:SSS family transporter
LTSIAGFGTVLFMPDACTPAQGRRYQSRRGIHLMRETRSVFPSFLILSILILLLLAATADSARAAGVSDRAAAEEIKKQRGAGKKPGDTEEQALALGAARRELSKNFTWVDWSVVAAYLLFTTVLGAKLAGRQATIRDFFLGGRRLPWPAVCGSIIATEISAATFLVVPAMVFAPGGSMVYLQLAIGTILARFIIGYWFVPAYYEREIYSPYDYMGHRLGERVKRIATALFVLGAVLAQGARVYIAALAVQVVAGTEVATAIILMGIFSILWTFIGGIRAVIWTDVIQFLLFTVGAFVAFGFVVAAVHGGIPVIFQEAYENGKLRLLDTSWNPSKEYTLWCGLLATWWLTLASHGTDQLNAQRMFTCRSPQAARKAIIWSSLSQVITICLLLVGAGVWVYYQHNPMNPAGAAVVKDNASQVFAVFIVDVLPWGVKGLVMSAIFAAAVSTFESALAALSQSTLETVYKPLRGWWGARQAPQLRVGPLSEAAEARRDVLISRLFVVAWGIGMMAFAIFCQTIAKGYHDLVAFALAMAAYTYGPLLGTFLLALLPTHRDDLGLLWGVPLSVALIFALNYPSPEVIALANWSWALLPPLLVTAMAGILAVTALRRFRGDPLRLGVILAFVIFLLFVEFAPALAHWTGNFNYIKIAFPWQYPIGTIMTFVTGYLVGNRREAVEKPLTAAPAVRI